MYSLTFNSFNSKSTDIVTNNLYAGNQIFFTISYFFNKNIHNYILFKQTDHEKISDFDSDVLTENIKIRKREPLLICKVCKNIITSPHNVIEIDGSHRHTFTNPEGIVYNIGCFKMIEGCIFIGDPIIEHTWFPGFSWQIVICSNCYSHLGWCFKSGDSKFYGLVMNNLIENE